ncbi:hypothetical protein KFE98_00370 [bacterium SCSIO 12741]|nr:hypothetical protein KFE98_00370 [bacterium SCSIO 12741]
MGIITAYLIKTLLFQILPGLSLSVLVARKWPEWPLPIPLAIGLGSASLIGIWLINIVMLLLPGLPAWVHVGLALVPLGVFLPWSLLNRSWVLVFQRLKGIAVWQFMVGTLAVGMVLMVALFYAYKKPVSEHDAFEYLALGKQLGRDRAITYSKYAYFENSGFFYVGRHAFAYPLNFTLESLSDSVVGPSDALYFRAYSSFYLLLLALLLYGILRLYFRDQSFWLTLFFILNYGLIFNALQFHLDSARIFFLLATVLVLIQWPVNPEKRHYITLGVFMGFQAYMHSIGAIFAGIELLALVVYLTIQKTIVWPKMAQVAALALLFGGYHYVIDTFWGTGWIF